MPGNAKSLSGEFIQSVLNEFSPIAISLIKRHEIALSRAYSNQPWWCLVPFEDVLQVLESQYPQHPKKWHEDKAHAILSALTYTYVSNNRLPSVEFGNERSEKEEISTWNSLLNLNLPFTVHSWQERAERESTIKNGHFTFLSMHHGLAHFNFVELYLPIQGSHGNANPIIPVFYSVNIQHLTYQDALSVFNHQLSTKTRNSNSHEIARAHQHMCNVVALIEILQLPIKCNPHAKCSPLFRKNSEGSENNNNQPNFSLPPITKEYSAFFEQYYRLHSHDKLHSYAA